MKIAVLVLNYNGRKHLRGFLEAAAFLRGEPEADVVVVDNASSDDSVAFVAREFPWALVVRNASNYGWGEGYNKGVAALLAEGRSYTHYMFINNDVFPTPAWYRGLLAAIRAAPPGVGEIGCRAVFAAPFLVEPLGVAATAQARDVEFELLNTADFYAEQVVAQGGRVALSGRSAPLNKPFSAALQRALTAGERAAAGHYIGKVRNRRPEPLRFELAPQLKLVRRAPLGGNACLVVATRGGDGATPLELAPDETALILRLVDADEPRDERIQNSGIALNRSFEGEDLHSYEPKLTPQNTAAIRGVCGVCKTVTRAAFEAVDGFDPAYFMYYEDLDFSLRVQAKGYTGIVASDVYLRHVHAGSTRAGSPFFRRQVAWSKLYFQYRHASFLRRLRTWISYKLNERRENAEDMHWMAKVHTLALAHFARVEGRSFLRGPGRA